MALPMARITLRLFTISDLPTNISCRVGQLHEDEHAVTLSVRVVPRAARSEIAGYHDGALANSSCRVARRRRRESRADKVFVEELQGAAKRGNNNLGKAIPGTRSCGSQIRAP